MDVLMDDKPKATDIEIKTLTLGTLITKFVMPEELVNDIKQLYEMVCDRNKTPDDIANVLLGMHTLYDDRFHQLMTSFENLIKIDSFPNPKSEESEDNISRYEELIWEKRYTDLLTKLRIISETDEIG